MDWKPAIPRHPHCLSAAVFQPREPCSYAWITTGILRTWQRASQLAPECAHGLARAGQGNRVYSLHGGLLENNNSTHSRPDVWQVFVVYGVPGTTPMVLLTLPGRLQRRRQGADPSQEFL